ncbi:MAG: InlB B-repeat-containing protein [Bacteroidales bacterium]|nr:InlB B-repeat-containing protein [Bacteroidales bacterium]
MKKIFALMTAMLLLMVTFSSCGDDGDDDSTSQVAEYTIKYDPNGGTGTIANTTYKAGDKVNISDGSGFTREGYVFQGWSSTPEGTSFDVNDIVGKNVTLYAVWKKVENGGENGGNNENPVTETSFTIKYDANGGTGTIDNTTIKAGEMPKLSDGTGFTREGYTFAGWASSPDGTEIDENAFVGKTEVTLYAVWKQNEAQQSEKVTLTFDLDGGTSNFPINSFDVDYGFEFDVATSKLAMVTVTKEGYTFKGWSTTKGGEVLTTFKAEQNTTLYAVWEKANQTVVEEDLPAFFPTGKEASNVVAWYAATTVSEGNIVTDAAFLFTDGSVTVTKNTLAGDVNTKAEVITLQYWFDGDPDYDNATVNVGPVKGVVVSTAEVKNGVLTVALVPGAEFKKQDNANVPAPSDPTK